MKKFVIVAASAMLGATLLFAGSVPSASAANKVNCDAVMTQLSSGKHAKDVAKDLSISTSSVYRCKKHAKEAAKAMTAANHGGPVASPAMLAAPAAKTK